MKSIVSAALVLAALISAPSFAVTDNALLGATMQSIDGDIDVIIAVTKKPAAQVKDSALLAAVTRARTAGFSLQLISDRREGEMFPTVLTGLPESEIKQKLESYAGYLGDAKAKLDAVDGQLRAEYDKPAAQRSFAAVTQSLNELSAIIKEAHGLFKPAKPNAAEER
jgi:hypothetical protein